MNAPGWSVLNTYATGFEADFVMAQLEAEGIPAVRDNHESTALFGLGFQGATRSGYTVMVPSEVLDEAQALLESAPDDVPSDVPTDLPDDVPDDEPTP